MEQAQFVDPKLYTRCTSTLTQLSSHTDKVLWIICYPLCIYDRIHKRREDAYVWFILIMPAFMFLLYLTGNSALAIILHNYLLSQQLQFLYSFYFSVVAMEPLISQFFLTYFEFGVYSSNFYCFSEVAIIFLAVFFAHCTTH